MPGIKYGKWTPENMIRALEEFKAGKITLNECCRKYEIPKKTFLRHVRGQVNRGVNRGTNMAVNGRQTALPEEAENELVDVILRFEESMFGLTITDVRKLSFQVLEANPHLKNPFNKEKKMAGKKWFYAFIKRHPTLSLRQPENVSIARARGFNRESVSHFFDMLEKTVVENTLNALRIFNVDESGFSTVQKKSPKILAQKGKHQVGSISSAERGVNTTIVCCTSASGNFVPPMIIFKRLRMHPSLKIGASPGAIVEISETGYINTELFIKWLQHFIAYVKPSAEEKVLLVLDGHTTHSKNLEAITLAKAHGVILLQLPGHTTHRLQPLDVAVFKPLQTYYDEAVSKWLRTYEPPVTQFEVSSLLSEAYSRAATLSNAMNGFKATGIWPVDRNVFSDADFIPSSIHSQAYTSDQPEEPPRGPPSNDDRPMRSNEENAAMPQSPEARPTSSRSLAVTVHEISPLPRPVGRPGKRLRKGAQKSELLTSTPYKNKLKDMKDKKSATLAKRMLKFNKTNNQPGTSSESSKTMKNKRTSAQSSAKEGNVEIEVAEEDWYCFICGESVVEDMVQCTMCEKWAHETCACVEKHEMTFECDNCSLQK